MFPQWLPCKVRVNYAQSQARDACQDAIHASRGTYRRALLYVTSNQLFAKALLNCTSAHNCFFLFYFNYV